jgi:hypothetical protein
LGYNAQRILRLPVQTRQPTCTPALILTIFPGYGDLLLPSDPTRSNFDRIPVSQEACDRRAHSGSLKRPATGGRIPAKIADSGHEVRGRNRVGDCMPLSQMDKIKDSAHKDREGTGKSREVAATFRSKTESLGYNTQRILRLPAQPQQPTCTPALILTIFPGYGDLLLPSDPARSNFDRIPVLSRSLRPATAFQPKLLIVVTRFEGKTGSAAACRSAKWTKFKIVPTRIGRALARAAK